MSRGLGKCERAVLECLYRWSPGVAISQHASRTLSVQRLLSETEIGKTQLSRALRSPLSHRFVADDEIQEAGRRRDIGDVGDPKLVGAVGGEIPVHEGQALGAHLRQIARASCSVVPTDAARLDRLAAASDGRGSRPLPARCRERPIPPRRPLGTVGSIHPASRVECDSRRRFLLEVRFLSSSL